MKGSRRVVTILVLIFGVAACGNVSYGGDPVVSSDDTRELDVPQDGPQKDEIECIKVTRYKDGWNVKSKNLGVFCKVDDAENDD